MHSRLKTVFYNDKMTDINSFALWKGPMARTETMFIHPTTYPSHDPVELENDALLLG